MRKELLQLLSDKRRFGVNNELLADEILALFGVSVPKGTLPKDYFTELDKIEQLGQNQESLQMQINVLRAFANKLGLYDVCDWLRDTEKAMHGRNNR